MIERYPTPWIVWTGKLLRPQFPVPIVEIRGPRGKTILPWGAFEHLDSFAAKKRLAVLIVHAVNEMQP